MKYGGTQSGLHATAQEVRSYISIGSKVKARGPVPVHGVGDWWLVVTRGAGADVDSGSARCPPSPRLARSFLEPGKIRADRTCPEPP